MKNRYAMTHRPLYRARDGWIFGVCKGIANYADLNVFWVRAALIAMVIFTAFLPVALIYLVAAIFIKPEPVIQPEDDEDWDFYNSYASDRVMAIARLKRRMESLERRARRLENTVTDKEFDWEERLRSNS